MWLRQITLLLLIPIISCTNTSKNDDVTSAQPSFPGFEDFPNSQYLQIRLGEELSSAENILFKKGFELQAETETKHYLRKSDGTEVIFQNGNTINNFRVFLKNDDFLSKKDEFLEFLAQKSSKRAENKNLVILTFDQNNPPFQLQYFSTKIYIRLKFESKK